MKDCKATLKDVRLPVLLRTCMIVCARSVSFGVPLEEAIFAATRNPAKSIGIYDEVGSFLLERKRIFFL